MEFKDKVRSIQGIPLIPNEIKILQVNLGYKCNMVCKHCHIGAGAHRNEEMGQETINTILRVLGENDIGTLDVTGGAPELNPWFRHLVVEAKNIGCHVVVRSNLTIFFEEGMEGLPEFYTENSVEIVASLPHYTETSVDRVRGTGTFQKCVRALDRLNRLGYADGSTDRKLNLVYNPQGAFLAPPQKTLEEDYKKELLERFEIAFDKLYTFSNMPIGRFRDYLVSSNSLEKYMATLINSFNPATIEGLMCRYLISVGWDGTLYDCDFNQILGLKLNGACPQHIKDFDYSGISRREINVGEHCYGCTAGQGST